ncbi:BCCT family transporter [Cobetia marina]|jgi:choline/glycine/proline betaine transport protein|uniref:Choline BCCT transporter BetT n=1 Tax=Cobetia marina TaxID=28258 RepID=A0ABU9GFY9_COBMA|nr:MULTISPECIES: choline BCCT transporter BetT [Cobetia]AOM02481.1 choline transporter [Cobetia marina]AZV32287.1 high-affinity choline transporter BetT [Cobetia sp. ICG0124]MDA5562875.1 choline BCCT transporter BetT [Cobetia sp. MMG027]MDH2291951.1 choline BCCT transporter BetT [Cobetia sp. 10Alg 146]MDH2373444.1 choline BCCT transporter BetT [Cobetia sp. 3AK]
MSENADQPTVAKINPPVFFGSAVVILAFVIFTVSMPETANVVFGHVQTWIIDTVGWFYLLAMGLFVVFTLGLAFSKSGDIKLGPDHSEPDFSYGSWFAMLFSAGMGIGLMFYGVAEPVFHFTAPPVGDAGTVEAAREAMKTTFFHWGIHAWGVYAVVALALAYFSFRHNLPLRISSALYPLIGKRIHGPIGHAVDIFAVFGTMFGVATSLGLGVLQVSSGLHYLFDIDNSLTTQVILIAIITGLATISVVMGLDGGIRRLSELNLGLALALMLFVLCVGPTIFLLQTLIQNIGGYLSEVVDKTFNMFAYIPEDGPSEWLGGWTLFYWGWWIAWSPFVGMFIARVSRGRTIREFVYGVLFVPMGFTFMWLTFFGDSALHLLMTDAAGNLAEAVSADASVALFKFLELFPFGSVTSLLATVLVVTFFVTSSDSGSLVIDMLTSKEGDESPVWQRIFWAVSEGFVAVALLMAGGLGALQTASLASALPFAIILMFVCYGLLKALRLEGVKQRSMQHLSNTPGHTAGGARSWQKRVQTLVETPQQKNVEQYLSDVVTPALSDVAKEFEAQGLDVRVNDEDDRSYLQVSHGDEIDFIYGVRVREYAAPAFALRNVKRKGTSDVERQYRAEVFLREGGQTYDLMGYTKEQVIGDVLDQYEKHMHFLHMARN